MKKYINKGEVGILGILIIVIIISFFLWLFTGGYQKKENKKSPFMQVNIAVPKIEKN
jgi:hypothetical protein